MVTKQRRIEGSIAALVTPMTADGSIDLERLTLLVEWHIQHKTNGLVIMGTTGESALVSETELLESVAACILIAKGRIDIIAGCGAVSTAASVAMVKKLETLAPAALLCVTPYYVKPMQQGLIEHYHAIADCSNIPVILYNVPSRTGCDLSNQSIVCLARHANIIGLKDATGDLDRVRGLRDKVPKDFSLLSGDDESAYEFVNRGGDGVISVTANVAPHQMQQWVSLLKMKQFEQALNVFNQLLPLHKNLFIESNPIPVKWALKVMGKIESGIRLPLTLPSIESKKLIEKTLRESGIV